MLGIMFAGLRKKQNLEEMVELIQNGDLELRNDLLKKFKPFIKKSVSSVCKRYIRETDDEFSIGLIAFNDAIDTFTPEKGNSLLSLADTMIKRRVIDYLRSQRRRNLELSLETEAEGEEGTLQNQYEAEKSLQHHQEELNNASRREEILHFSGLLETYNITFKHLVQQSPKHTDARENAIMIAKMVAEDEYMLNYLRERKRLPLKLLEEKVDVSRKTIERNRIYIVAMVLIFTGDYVFLNDYLKGVLNK